MRFIFGFLVGSVGMALFLVFLYSVDIIPGEQKKCYELGYQQGIVDCWEQLNSFEDPQ